LSSERATALEAVDQNIRDLGGIFQQLATMISQQQEQVERIDMNMDDTLHYVDEGHSQLLQYFKSVSSNRSLMIKSFAVVIFFAILFILFGT
jgi:syntaxin 5